MTTPPRQPPSPMPPSQGGFDVVLGNPPWERVKLQEKEWFANRSPDIAAAPSAAERKRRIEGLKSSNPELYSQFLDDSRQASSESQLLRSSGRYPLCGRGDINLYAVFAENMRTVLAPRGRVGAVLPSGVATGDTTKAFFQDLFDSQSLVSLLSFFEIRLVFPGTDSREPFSLFTAGSGKAKLVDKAEFVWFARTVGELSEAERRFSLTSEELLMLKPNTRNCPVFQSTRDAAITKRIYRHLPVLISDGPQPENPWSVKFGTMLHMSNDSGLFKTALELERQQAVLVGNRYSRGEDLFLPLYEQNLIHLCDHRYATFRAEDGSLSFERSRLLSHEEHDNPVQLALPRYWVRQSDIASELQDKYGGADWTLAFRRSARSNDLRTALFCGLPKFGVGDSIFLLSHAESDRKERLPLLLGQLVSYVFDFTARQSIGGENANFFIMKQLPVLPPNVFVEPAPWDSTTTLEQWLLPRVLELVYTAEDLRSFALDCRWSGPPFTWQEDRRHQLQCELDACMFHLFLPSESNGGWKQLQVATGSRRDETPHQTQELLAYFPAPRDAVDHIMETFPVVRQKEEAAHGVYRSKQAILEIYDAMQDAMRTGRHWSSPLDPPPGPPTRADGSFVDYAEIAENPPPNIHPPRSEA